MRMDFAGGIHHNAADNPVFYSRGTINSANRSP